MKPKYTAKVFLEEDQVIEKNGENLEELLAWIYSQAEASFADINGEIIDNTTHKIVKSVQYSPPDL